MLGRNSSNYLAIERNLMKHEITCGTESINSEKNPHFKPFQTYKVKLKVCQLTQLTQPAPH
jgi:hypothetical protein